MKPALRKKLKWAAAFSVLGPLLICILYFNGTFQRLEMMAYDAMVKLKRSDKEAHPDIAIILIDEASIKAMNSLIGRWPWPRTVYADLLDFLSMGGARAVAFDILYTENERHDGAGLSIGDQIFIEATYAGGNVYHAAQILRDIEDDFNKSLLDRDIPGDFREMFGIKGLKAEENGPANNFYLPIPELYHAARGIGVVEFEPDPDGVYRRTGLLRQYKNDFYPVMGIAPLLKGSEADEITITDESLVLNGTSIPLHGEGKYLINMYGKFNTYSMSGILASLQKILMGDVEDLIVYPDEFEDKIVFISASAVGVEDVKATPLESRMPGVMLHASLASNILNNDFLESANPLTTIISILIISAATVFGVLMLSNLYWRLLAALLPTGIYIAIAVSGFGSNKLYDMAPQVSTMMLSFVASFIYLSFTEGREKRKVRKMLGQYVSPQVLSEIVDKHEDFLKAEVGTKEQITLLFSDIRGFTTISEGLPADKVVSMLNHYFSVWSDVIFKHEGTIDKFVGDAVMALWGAPLRTENHAKKAVLAASEMVQKLPEINKVIEEMGLSPIRIGIGIHTGEAILGNIGSEKKLDYTVIGDTVNLASRLEGLTKTYSCDILVSEATYESIKGTVECSYVDKVKVKGKDIAVDIYKVNTG
jgi:adenylate cyclase